MKIEGVIKQGSTMTRKEELQEDPFSLLHAENEGRIAATVGRSYDYGAVKVSFTVSVACGQSKAALDRAAELCFQTALEYVNDGWSYLVPEDPQLEPPVKEIK